MEKGRCDASFQQLETCGMPAYSDRLTLAFGGVGLSTVAEQRVPAGGPVGAAITTPRQARLTTRATEQSVYLLFGMPTFEMLALS